MALVTVSDLKTYMDISFSNRQEDAAQFVIDGLQSELETYLRRPIEVASFTEDYVLESDHVGLPMGSTIFNDFYQASAFNPKHQILAFYYKVKYEKWREIETGQHEVPLTTEGEKHRWIDLDTLEIAMFTFPIDKIVCKHLMAQ
jgi:hypothetical protein